MVFVLVGERSRLRGEVILSKRCRCGPNPADDKYGSLHKAHDAGPNEKKMSDGGRRRASLGVEVWKSF
jgi:hypothetical protein